MVLTRATLNGPQALKINPPKSALRKNKPIKITTNLKLYEKKLKWLKSGQIKRIQIKACLVSGVKGLLLASG